MSCPKNVSLDNSKQIHSHSSGNKRFMLDEMTQSCFFFLSFCEKCGRTLGFSIYEINGYGINIWSTSLGLVISQKPWKLGWVIFSVVWPAKDRSNMRNIGKKYLFWDHSKTHAHNLISENFKIVFSLQISENFQRA